jgi:hypothetical protein
MVERWGRVGEAIIAAGYHQVHTSPMHWQGDTIGAFNAFHHNTQRLDEATLSLAQAFADIATAVIVQSSGVSGHELTARINEALRGRVIIEQAKGVLAEKYGLDMGAAYDTLVTWPPTRPDETLTQIAHRIVQGAVRGDL